MTWAGDTIANNAAYFSCLQKRPSKSLVELSCREVLAMPVNTFPVLGGGATIVWNSGSLVNLLVGDSFFVEDPRNFSPPPPHYSKSFCLFT